MNQRESWQKVLDSETLKWSTRSCEQLMSELPDERVYRVESDGASYEVSVQILERTDQYVQVMVSVNGGGFWGFIHPLSDTFVSRRGER